MKPNGLTATLQTTTIHRWADMLWEAVQEAQCANVTPRQFKNELIEAWEYELERDMKYATKIFKEDK